VLNRHPIVLFLGTAALLSLAPLPARVYTLTGAAFLLILVGLLLDPGLPGARASIGHLLQAVGVVFAWADVASSAAWSLSFALAQAGVALAVMGILFEMRVGFGAVRLAIGLQACGDALYVAGFAAAVIARAKTPSGVGWAYLSLSGAVSLFAAFYNLSLQIRRLADLQTGWRYRVRRLDASGLSLKTPAGETRIDWGWVSAVQRLDGRHLIIVLPSPLPFELASSGLPLDELRRGSEVKGAEEGVAPEQYGLILHEQEIGRALPDAEKAILGGMKAARSAR
jgi:hypothetical protein